jgi:hypothetical protein
LFGAAASAAAGAPALACGTGIASRMPPAAYRAVPAKPYGPTAA